MTAEPFDCAVCGRRLGAPRLHIITEPDHIVCPSCAADRCGTHAKLYPDCDVARHVIFSYRLVWDVTRAGARRWLRKQAEESA